MYVENQCYPLIANSTIQNHITNSYPAIYLRYSLARFYNVDVINNNGTAIKFSSVWNEPGVILENITATNNAGYGIELDTSYDIYMVNSIIWDNVLSQNLNSSIITPGGQGEIDYDYSNIVYPYPEWIPCCGNISQEPQFNDDYSLEIGSPCIDSGDPNLWYNDLDGSRNDMGKNGGLFVYPSFKSYDFGEVGSLGGDTTMEIYNARNDGIVIDSVAFSNNNVFNTNSVFPMHIEANRDSEIDINCISNYEGFIQDSMIVYSTQLPENLPFH